MRSVLNQQNKSTTRTENKNPPEPSMHVSLSGPCHGNGGVVRHLLPELGLALGGGERVHMEGRRLATYVREDVVQDFRLAPARGLGQQMLRGRTRAQVDASKRRWRRRIAIFEAERLLRQR